MSLHTICQDTIRLHRSLKASYLTSLLHTPSEARRDQSRAAHRSMDGSKRFLMTTLMFVLIISSFIENTGS